jgi:hypothetical protein
MLGSVGAGAFQDLRVLLKTMFGNPSGFSAMRLRVCKCDYGALYAKSLEEAVGAKVMISTPVDPVTAELLDSFCAKIHRNRAEVMRGLLYALLVEDKQFIFDEWREQAKAGDTPSTA